MGGRAIECCSISQAIKMLTRRGPLKSHPRKSLQDRSTLKACSAQGGKNIFFHILKWGPDNIPDFHLEHNASFGRLERQIQKWRCFSIGTLAAIVRNNGPVTGWWVEPVVSNTLSVWFPGLLHSKMHDPHYQTRSWALTPLSLKAVLIWDFLTRRSAPTWVTENADDLFLRKALNRRTVAHLSENFSGQSPVGSLKDKWTDL